MSLVRHGARRHTLARISMLVLLTVLISSASAVASVTKPAVPALSDGFRADMATLADAVTYTGFVHFRSGGVDDHKRLLRARGLVPASNFEVVDAWYAYGPVAAWRTLVSEPTISYLEDVTRYSFFEQTSKHATRVADVEQSFSGGPYRLANGKVIDGAGVGVAILDTGIDATHPDVENRVVKNFRIQCSTPGLVHDGGPEDGECFGEPAMTEAPDTDRSGHGSHVAGIVGGDGTSSAGIFKGMATGSGLYGFSFWDGAGAFGLSDLDAGEAFRWILENGAAQNPPIKIVNNSWGCIGGCPFDPNDIVTKLVDKLVDAGVLVIWAAGNDGGTGTALRTSGASANPKPGVLGVANYDDNGSGDRNFALSSTSSRGLSSNAATWPDVSAPGTFITAACKRDKALCGGGEVPAPYQPWYASISGTSMAAPYTAGIAALLLEADPSLTPAQIEDLLQDTAHKFTAGAAYQPDPQNPGGTASFDKGAGLVDAATALLALGAKKAAIGFTGAPSVATTTPADGSDQDGPIAVSGAVTDGQSPPFQTTRTPIVGDGGDFSGHGAVDLVSFTSIEQATGMRYEIVVRDAADFPPSQPVRYRILQNINGKGAWTNVDCTATGCTPVAAVSATNNHSPATSASLDAGSDTVSFFVPFTNYSNIGPNSIVHQTQIGSYVGAIQDVAPGGPGAELLTAPKYLAPWHIQGTPEAAPAVEVKVSVDGGPATDAAVGGSSPNYTWSTNVDLSTLPAGAHTITAKLFVNGALRDTDDVDINIPARNPAVSLSAGSLPFADQEVGTLSAAQTVTVTNTGNGSLLLGALSSDSDFPLSADTCSNASVSPAGSCTVNVRFGPSAIGARAGTLSIPSNAATSPDTVALSGTGLSPSVTLSTTSLTFGSEPVGSTSTAQSVTVTNTGTSPLSIGTASFAGTNDGDFLRAADTCDAQTIAVGDSCTIDVAFAPTAGGARSASLSIPSSAPNSPSLVSLSGTGLGLPSVTTNPASHSFGNVFVGSAPSKSITVTNGGGLPLTIGTLTLTGTDPAEFALASNTCNGATLAPSGSCTFAAKFVPTTSGVRSASVSIPSNAPGSPHSVPLDGTGVLGNPVARINPASVVFGGVISGQSSPFRSVSVQNTGTGVLAISSVTLGGTDAGQFRKLNDSCTGKSLSANQACSMSVQFRPTSAGDKTADLTITTNAAASPHVAVLTGTGLVDEAAPETTITTEEGEILIAVLDKVSGKVTDDVLGVSKVNVRFTSSLGTSTVTASLSGCNTQKTSCNWSATVPVTHAGPTVVDVWAVDAAAHVEDPPKQVAVVVI